MKQIFAIIIFFINITCFGQEIVISKNIKLPYDLSSEVGLFEDATAKLSFEEVKKQPFTKNNANRVLLPFSNNATWLKIAIKNNALSDSVFYFLIDNVLLRKTILYTDNQSDSKVFEPFKVRGVGKLKSPYFQIKLKQGESKNVYFKLESQRGIYIVLQLYDSKGFEKLNDSSKIGFGFMSGLTWMVMFVVFAIGFLIVKDSKSKAYAIYTFIRALGFWAATNVLGSMISADSLVSEKITFVLISISPMVSAFFALNILPFDKLPKWSKKATYGFIVANLLLLIYLLWSYGSIPLKSLAILTIISHIFFYSAFIFTLVKKINEYPYYSIPFLLGNLGNLFLNARVLGIINFEYMMQLAVILALLELAVYVYYLSHIFRLSVKNQAEKLKNLGFEAEKATKLEELNKLKTRFFTNISHEFRTPLTLILSPIDDLSKKYPNETLFNSMKRNAQRLLMLINQLLDLSKLDSGQMTMAIQRSDLVKFVQVLASSFNSVTENRSIDFKIIQNRKEAIAYFDADKIEKILVNLISNAFKFTKDNGAIEVLVNYSEDFSSTEIIVKDSGIGISAQKVNQIFDRFYQIDGSHQRNYEGSGIGLALVKEMVTLHKGTIRVESTEGIGTSFYVNLPINKITWQREVLHEALEENFDFTPPILERTKETFSDITKMNEEENILLIIEDNTDLRQYIRSVFEQDYQIIEAVDGQDGMEKSLEFIPDIVICDLMMPRLDGFGFCKLLKNDEKTSHIPVVMLTAKANIESRIEGFELGADDYLSKPFNKQEILARVKNLITQRTLLRQKFDKQIVDLKPSEVKVNSIEEKFIIKAKEIVERHLSESEFDVEKFAQEMGMTSVVLRRKLKAISGQTVTEFVRNYRLQRAADLLSKRTGSVSEIAYQVGFESLSYFTKVFQEEFGVSPSEYKM